VFGNKVSETTALGGQRAYSHGEFGRLQTQTDELGRTTTFSYDRFGRQTGESRPKDATVSGAKSITRSYDAAGHLTGITDNTTHVSTSYGYDVAGNRTRETVTSPDFDATGGFGTTTATARNVTYTYNGAGCMTSWNDATTGK